MAQLFRGLRCASPGCGFCVASAGAALSAFAAEAPRQRLAAHFRKAHGEISGEMFFSACFVEKQAEKEKENVQGEEEGGGGGTAFAVVEHPDAAIRAQLDLYNTQLREIAAARKRVEEAVALAQTASDALTVVDSLQPQLARAELAPLPGVINVTAGGAVVPVSVPVVPSSENGAEVVLGLAEASASVDLRESLSGEVLERMRQISKQRTALSTADLELIRGVFLRQQTIDAWVACPVDSPLRVPLPEEFAAGLPELSALSIHDVRDMPRPVVLHYLIAAATALTDDQCASAQAILRFPLPLSEVLNFAGLLEQSTVHIRTVLLVIVQVLAGRQAVVFSVSSDDIDPAAAAPSDISISSFDGEVGRRLANSRFDVRSVLATCMRCRKAPIANPDCVFSCCVQCCRGACFPCETHRDRALFPNDGEQGLVAFRSAVRTAVESAYKALPERAAICAIKLVGAKRRDRKLVLVQRNAEETSALIQLSARVGEALAFPPETISTSREEEFKRDFAEISGALDPDLPPEPLKKRFRGGLALNGSRARAQSSTGSVVDFFDYSQSLDSEPWKKHFERPRAEFQRVSATQQSITAAVIADIKSWYLVSVRNTNDDLDTAIGLRHVDEALQVLGGCGDTRDIALVVGHLFPSVRVKYSDDAELHKEIWLALADNDALSRIKGRIFRHCRPCDNCVAVRRARGSLSLCAECEFDRTLWHLSPSRSPVSGARTFATAMQVAWLRFRGQSPALLAFSPPLSADARPTWDASWPVEARKGDYYDVTSVGPMAPRLAHVIWSVMSHELAISFLEPVDLRKVKEYLQMCPRPIDFAVIHNLLLSGFYDIHDGEGVDEKRLFDDVRLLLKNAFRFNNQHSVWYGQAHCLSAYLAAMQNKSVSPLWTLPPPLIAIHRSSALEAESGSAAGTLAENRGNRSWLQQHLPGLWRFLSFEIQRQNSRFAKPLGSNSNPPPFVPYPFADNEIGVTGSDIAVAGFYFMPCVVADNNIEADRCLCVQCSLEVLEWEEGDVPWFEHATGERTECGIADAWLKTANSIVGGRDNFAALIEHQRVLLEGFIRAFPSLPLQGTPALSSASLPSAVLSSASLPSAVSSATLSSTIE